MDGAHPRCCALAFFDAYGAARCRDIRHQQRIEHRRKYLALEYRGAALTGSALSEPAIVGSLDTVAP